MATNILFKRGLHANLPSGANVVDGAFYLTTDSHRLYAGINSQLVDLNQYIQVVSTVADLDNLTNIEAGDFAYVQTGNILAIYQAGGWVQINKNTDTLNSSLTISNKTLGTDGKVTGTSETDRFTISLVDAQGNEFNDTIKLVGAGGTDVAVDADGNITITGSTYELVTELNTGTFTIGLNASSNDVADTQFALHAGNNIAFKGDNAGGITISATDTTLVAGTDGGSFETNADGGATVTISDTSGATAIATAANGSFFYKVGAGTTKTTVNNKGELPVYTITEIDNMMKGLNPMKYKGSVADASDLTGKESTAELGDTYMASAPFSLQTITGETKNCKIGDLFIATGTENANGVITDVTWTYIPAGDDSQTDTVYHGTVDTSAHKITIQDQNDNVAASLDFDAGASGKITLTSAKVTEENGEGLKLTVDHAGPGAEDGTKKKTGNALDDVVSFTVVTSAKVDATGHVSEYTTQTIKVPVYTLKTLADATATGNVASVVTTLNDTTGTQNNTSTFQIAGDQDDNLVVTASGNKVTIALEWGTF